MVKDLTQKMPTDNVLLVDALNLAFRWKHQKATTFATEYVNTIRSLARSYSCGQIIVAADMGGSSYRKEIYPEYKANRKVLADAQSPEEKEYAKVFFAEYERALELIDSKYLLFRYQGVEADDIAAYIVAKRRWYGFNNIWLITSDKDWDLLIKPDVSRFSTVTRKETTLDTWNYEVAPEDYLSYKCLIGDTGDNIPGVVGVGPKRAAKLIYEFGSAMDIADSIPLPGKLKYIESVNRSKEQIIQNYELMDLESYCEDAIGPDNVRDIGMRLMLNERMER